MPVLDISPRLIDLMLAIGRGEPIPGYPVPGSGGAQPARTSSRISTAEADGACVTTVIAAANYPDPPRTGDVVTLPPTEDGVFVFHAGTARNADGQLVTAGGRVLAVSAVAPSVELAQARSMEFVERVRFEGKQYRPDIGWREIERQVQRAGAGAPRD
jgi:phosphoribosylamine--glycine ligase